MASVDSPRVFVVSTPPHKFSVAFLGDVAALLHSNQDDTREGYKFTLAQHLSGSGPKEAKMTRSEAIQLLLDVCGAACGKKRHEDVFRTHFGSSFKRGNDVDYWAVSLPITAVWPTQ